MASLHVKGASLRFKNLLIVIKQTAFEEYSQVGRLSDVADAEKLKLFLQLLPPFSRCELGLVAYYACS